MLGLRTQMKLMMIYISGSVNNLIKAMQDIIPKSDDEDFPHMQTPL